MKSECLTSNSSVLKQSFGSSIRLTINNIVGIQTKFRIFYTVFVFSMLFSTGCIRETVEGPTGKAGQDATVYYSEWFTPSDWAGGAGDWYFDVSAPDLTQNIVENGVVLSYVWLAGDLYNATATRPLPANAMGANWSFLIHEYKNIQFTSDMIAKPATSGNKFRFIAIPGTITALKSTSSNNIDSLKKMSYFEVCEKFHINP